MAKRRNRNVAEQTIEPNEKIARLLAMLLTKEVKKDSEKIPLLRSAGFDTSQIADILGTTEGTVRVAHHRARKKKKNN